MTPCRPIATYLLAALLLLGGQRRAAAIRTEQIGPAPAEQPMSSGAPKGIADIKCHQSRVYWYEVNSDQHAYFDGSIEPVNELLDLYSRADLAEHIAILRLGKPSAKAMMEEKTIPYVVDLHIPDGMGRLLIPGLGDSGLYPNAPRLTVHLSAELVDHLDELKIPDNLALRDLSVTVEDALRYADGDDSYLRHLAIVALGEAGDSSGPAVKAVRTAMEDEKESLRTAATQAFEQIVAAQEPQEQALRKRVREFTAQYSRVPTPEELLETLRSIDDKYNQGFTARGTLADTALSGHPRLIAWTVTMGDGKLVIQQLDDQDAAPAAGRSEHTVYAGPKQMGNIQRYRHWVDGELQQMGPFVSLEPVGNTYDIYIGRFLWPLGRGYSGRIEKIVDVKERHGLLVATAAGKSNWSSRLELTIDPRVDYLVRSARMYRQDEDPPSYAVESAGVLRNGDRITAHTTRFTEAGAPPLSIAVTSLASTADADLITETERRIDEAPDPRR